MEMKNSDDVQTFFKDLIAENFLLLNEIQNDNPNLSENNIVALKAKKRTSVNLIEDLEARLMFIKAWIDGTEDQLSNNIENGSFDPNKASTFKKACTEIGLEIKDSCDEIDKEYEVLQMKEKLLLEKVEQIQLKSEKCKELHEKKWGKVVEIFGPQAPEKLSNFEEQLIEKIEDAQRVYQTSRDNINCLKKKAVELKKICENLKNKLKEKESKYKILKKELDEKTIQIKEDFEISEKIRKLYESFTNVTLEETGKNFLVVKIANEIHPKSEETLLVTLYLKSSDQQDRIFLDDIQVSNSHLYITDCVEHGKALQNIPACLNSIRERWHYYLNMTKHLGDIQERLPVDWIQQENKLRVVVGKNANIICTLKLPSAEQSWVSLLDVRGGDVKVKTELLKPSNAEASLQEWIEYLERQFS